MKVPSNNATLDVWHAWLCHGADADGTGGEPCHGCQGITLDPERLPAFYAMLDRLDAQERLFSSWLQSTRPKYRLEVHR